MQCSSKMGDNDDRIVITTNLSIKQFRLPFSKKMMQPIFVALY